MNKLILLKKGVFYLLPGLFCLFMLIFVNRNHDYYKETIAKVTNVQIIEEEKITDYYGNTDTTYTQFITGKILNGNLKGRYVELNNQYTYSSAADNSYKKGDDLFISVDDSTKDILTGSIKGLKRDGYIVLMAVLFTVFILIIGRKKGLFSLLSLIFNIILFSMVMDLYIKGANLLLACSIVVIVFTIISLLFVSGYNKKTFISIISTLIGTFMTLLIAYVTMRLTNESGVRYEEMQFLTRPPHEIFMGLIGAVIDTAISIASSMNEVFLHNPSISRRKLFESGMNISRDILGTTTNTLYFAFVGGYMALILWMKDLNYTFAAIINSKVFCSEIISILFSGLGVTLVIPVTAGITSLILIPDRFRLSKPK